MRTYIAAAAIMTLYPLAATAQQAYVPAAKNPNGPELVAVFVTAEFCHGSRQPHMPETIERMKVLLMDHAAGAEEGLSVVGISLDWQTREGVDHLAKFGAFDEIIVGRNWFGTGAIRYIWRDVPGEPATPQVIVLRRTVTPAGRSIEFSEETEIGRFVGADDIKAWVDAGAPVRR